MNVLIIGNGGREHALAWKTAQSPLVKQVYVAAGNAGTDLADNLINVDLAVTDLDGLLAFAQKEAIDLTIVGPEIPLVLGIVDQFKAAGLKCFGPSKAAAQLEGSKSFSKDFLARHHIPTADYAYFTEIPPALTYLDQCDFPIVIKADGLAAGKGVIIAQTKAEAAKTVEDMLSGNAFGEAGHRVLIEAFLVGEEASFIVMADGKNILPMASSQDHKAALDGDKGENTGGMGAYSPAPVVTDEMHQKIMQTVIEPTIQGMADDGIPYSGFLYAGVMIDHTGQPRVLEFNCRFGDPETQPIMMRLKSDLVAHCLAAIDQNLDKEITEWDERSALGVVLAAEGYPQSYKTGLNISGLVDIHHPDVMVFHAGTTLNETDILTNGGRVLCVTALGQNVAEAQKLAYQTIQKISWQGMTYRTDIGYRAIARENN